MAFILGLLITTNDWQARKIIGASILLIFIPICILLLVLHGKNRLQPPLILKAEGFQLRNYPQLLPWSVLDNVGIDSPSKGMNCLALFLKSLPADMQSERCLGIRLSKKQSRILINGNALRLRGQASLVDAHVTIQRYAANAYARKRLAELGVKVDG